jgi:hypothetical protein
MGRVQAPAIRSRRVSGHPLLNSPFVEKIVERQLVFEVETLLLDD